jgi:glycerophosphoryl diester phosphodiesterase
VGGSLLLWIYAFSDRGADPMIAGRRGDVANWPENTLEGFESATALGSPAIEIDVRLSADGTFYLLHDDTVDRTTTGSGPISSMSDEALDRLVIDGGLGYRPEHTDIRVPRLVDALNAATEYDGLLLLDAKGGPAEHARLRDLVRERGIEDRIWIGCYSSAEVDAVREVAPTYGASHTGADALLVGYPLPLATWFAESTVAAVDQCHVGDESGFLDQARRWGVDIFITNDLAAALEGR